jgi:hypothetical protein
VPVVSLLNKADDVHGLAPAASPGFTGLSGFPTGHSPIAAASFWQRTEAVFPPASQAKRRPSMLAQAWKDFSPSQSDLINGQFSRHFENVMEEGHPGFAQATQ